MKIYTNIANQFPSLDLEPMHVTGRFWRPNEGEDRTQLPDRDYFIEQCRGDGPLCINIEHWRWDIRRDSHTTVDASLAKLCTLTKWATEAFPGRVIGHYSLFPLRDYWTPQYSKILHPLKWAAWRRANGYIKKSRDANGRYNSVGLSDLSHITMPSLYTFYEDQAGWVKYATANIKEARKYGKPVIPFIWARYHNSNDTLKLTGIPGDYWKLQLETLDSLGIDEVIIWDAVQYFVDRGGDAWTEETPWIEATRNFIEQQA